MVLTLRPTDLIYQEACFRKTFKKNKKQNLNNYNKCRYRDKYYIIKDLGIY